MSGFGKLYRELCNNHPVGNLTKTTDNVNYFDERIEVMRMIGLGPGSKGASSSSKKGPMRAPRNRHHGKEARYRAPEARLKALKEDNGVTAVKRLEIARAVNEVTKSFEVSKQLGTFVKEKKPFPQKLLRELLGKKAMRGGKDAPLSPIIKRKPVDFGPEPRITVGKEPVKVMTVMESKWQKDERDYLNMLYEELERPTAKVPSLWNIYYRSMYERFRPFYPRRTYKEVREKVVEMIKKRQFKTTVEKEFWDNVSDRGAVVRGERSPDKPVEHINIINEWGEQSAELSGNGSLSLLKAPSSVINASTSKVM